MVLNKDGTGKDWNLLMFCRSLVKKEKKVKFYFAKIYFLKNEIMTNCNHRNKFPHSCFTVIVWSSLPLTYFVFSHDYTIKHMCMS